MSSLFPPKKVTHRIVTRACDKLKIPFVHGAIAGFSGQLMTIFPGDKGLNAICGLSGNENEYGIERHTGNPATIAAWEVLEAIKIIIGENR